MVFYDYYNPYELTHWGIKGMKWGVRRFQNKDGSLTIDGGKRYNGSDYQPRKSLGERISDYKKASKRKKALDKARATKEAKKKAEEDAKAAAEQRKKDIESGKIKTKDMTDDEIKQRIDRLNAEKKLNQLMEETGHNSVIEKAVKTAVDKVWNDAILPGVAEAGKQIVKDSLISANKRPKSESEVLEQLAKDWKNKANIARDKKAEWENQRDFVESKKKYEDHLKEEKSQAAQEKKDTKADKKAAKAEKKAEKVKQKLEKDMKDYEAFQERERQNREEQPSNVGKESATGKDIPYRKGYTSPDSTNPARFSNVKYYPAVQKASAKLAKVPANSKEYADKVYKGEQLAYDVIGSDGKTIVRFDKNGKRKLW